jgi:hypothetical protein
VGGALPEQQGPPPDLQTLLSSLTGSGKAQAAVKTSRQRQI